MYLLACVCCCDFRHFKFLIQLRTLLTIEKAFEKREGRKKDFMGKYQKLVELILMKLQSKKKN